MWLPFAILAVLCLMGLEVFGWLDTAEWRWTTLYDVLLLSNAPNVFPEDFSIFRTKFIGDRRWIGARLAVLWLLDRWLGWYLLVGGLWAQIAHEK